MLGVVVLINTELPESTDSLFTPPLVLTAPATETSSAQTIVPKDVMELLQIISPETDWLPRTSNEPADRLPAANDLAKVRICLYGVMNTGCPGFEFTAVIYPEFTIIFVETQNQLAL